MAVEDEWLRAWQELEARKTVLEATIQQGVGPDDPVRKEQIRALQRAIGAFAQIVVQL